MFIIGPVASLLGYLMDAIYNFLELIGIPNIGLSIILFIYAHRYDINATNALNGV